MNLSTHISEDFKSFIENSNSLLNQDPYIISIKKIFTKIYFLNYSTARIEVRKTYESDYFSVTRSCLLESFMLFSQNYLRASSLVLRSSIENFIKFLLGLYNQKIDDRVYTNNKNELDNFIKSSKKFPPNARNSFIQMNNKLLTLYKQLSGISHSLTQKSKVLSINFTNDIVCVSSEDISEIDKKLNQFLDLIIMCIIHLNKNSLNHLPKSELNSMFRLVMGNKKTARLLEIIKNEQDLQFIH